MSMSCVTGYVRFRARRRRQIAGYIPTPNYLNKSRSDPEVSETIIHIDKAGPKKVLLSAHDTCDHALERLCGELNAETALQVHPQGTPDNPLTGVFATHSPVRPNLFAMTRCQVLSVKENVIEIESIDAFPDTPVLDIES